MITKTHVDQIKASVEAAVVHSQWEESEVRTQLFIKGLEEAGLIDRAEELEMQARTIRAEAKRVRMQIDNFTAQIREPHTLSADER